jgi:protein-S-isoprenylcysteine O-methyltransferase Ste14
MLALRSLAAIVLLPGTVTVLIPALLLGAKPGTLVPSGGLSGAELAPWPLALLGGVLIGFGVATIAWTVALFAGVGRGTLAPWDPPARLVVRGPYRYVRNPMITGVVSVLLGQSALFGSVAVLVWAAIVFAINAVYFPLVEEADLRHRFGAEYEEYAARTPRWVPRPGR